MPEMPEKIVAESDNSLEVESFLKQVEEARPEREILPIGHANYYRDRKLGEASRYFRSDVGPRTVEVFAGGINGRLVFNPELDSLVDIDDEDYGGHRDDSTGHITYIVNYILSEANFGAISDELKEKIDISVAELKKPNWRTDLFTHHADWVDASTYQEEMAKIKKLSPQDREKVSGNKNDPSFNLLSERIENANSELDNLLKELPVENYGSINEEGDIEWFGLPVKREPVEGITQTLVNAGRVVMGEKIGVSNFKIELFKTKLAVWLDQYGDSLEGIIEQKGSAAAPEKIDIKELNVSVREYTEKLAQELGVVKKDRPRNNSDWIYVIGEDVLNLEVALRSDYQGLRARVMNINSGMGKIAGAETIADIIKEKGFILSGNAEKILVPVLNEEKLTGIRRDKKFDQIDTAKTEGEIKKLGGRVGVERKIVKPAAEAKEDSGESSGAILEEIKNLFAPVNKENYYKFGIYSTEFEEIGEEIKAFERTLGKQNKKERDDLIAVRKKLRDMENYSKRREESFKKVDESIEKYYGKCPLCGAELIDDSCRAKHDFNRFDFEVNGNLNRVGPLILSEIKTGEGLVIAQMRVSDEYDRKRNPGEIYLVFDRDTGDKGWDFKPFEEVEYTDYGKILSPEEGKSKEEERMKLRRARR